MRKLNIVIASLYALLMTGCATNFKIKRDTEDTSLRDGETYTLQTGWTGPVQTGRGASMSLSVKNLRGFVTHTCVALALDRPSGEIELSYHVVGQEAPTNAPRPFTVRYGTAMERDTVEPWLQMCGSPPPLPHAARS
jgi:hypothetical protein